MVMAPWRQALESSLALMSAVGAMAPMRHAYECSWLLMSAHEYSKMLMKCPEHGAMSTHEQ